MSDKIQVGDIVTVNFNCARYTLGFNLEVVKVPQATGDSWGFKDHVKNEIHFVSEGCTITKYTGE